jgi:serine phosphatase RsbU (regulator of sigma subunit)/PAS domain-containing protein
MLALLTAATVVAAVLLAALALYVWRRRGSAAGASLAVLLVSVAWWAAAYVMELSSGDLALRAIWGDLKYVGVLLVPPAWLIFVAQYTGRTRLASRRMLLLLAVQPVAVWVLLAVPATHDLVRYYRPSTREDQIPDVAAGPLFWPVLGYANVILVIATGLFVISMVRLSRVYRVAAVVLVVAALLPWAANLLYNFEVGPFARLDLTPFAFVVTGAVLVWGLHRERLINLSSVAWGVVVATMTDGVVLCDAFGRVVDVNPAAERLLGRTRGELIGKVADELVRPEMTLEAEGRVRHVESHRQALPGPAGAPVGELVTLRDVTAQKQDEARLRALLEERTRLAATLQSSLLPVRLPAISGCRLAAVYEPAGAGHEVGGDFYDVFPLDGRWGIVLGDVSGKGAQAAAVTALIRYTLRTLALAHSRPSAVLRRLNEVLLRDTEPEQFCTLVYAVAGATDAGVELDLCLGGHHPPLLRHGDGGVQPVGTLGTALGLVPDPALVDTAVTLGAGDLLCLFTDGLVEARSSGDYFDGARVAEVLTEARDLGPQGTLDRLAFAVHEFRAGPLSDDLAMLALSVPAQGDRQDR